MRMRKVTESKKPLRREELAGSFPAMKKARHTVPGVRAAGFVCSAAFGAGTRILLRRRGGYGMLRGISPGRVPPRGEGRKRR